ncbi:phosphotransferase family protein [Corallococcus macrosporus]|uniref:Aminoglycoside phosphotransferase family protein n=1 Tax=Myxococcus fulvus (strain ATCC BAA-855 / HW-1) TaxID=483219 RepID=F8CE98_MYXFH|nr:phosphotransferase [Corallococcus macrosporus]AEI63559.1 aminoglycoside phosphotransferase family protein [Corallococcus macrosporus]
MTHDAEPPLPALTDAEAAERIHARFPALATARVVRLGEGMDHQAFEVAGRHVFRFPRSDAAAGHLEWEARLTAWLAPRLPLPIPVYRFLAPSTADLVVGFGGYEKLPGTPALLVEPGRLDLSDLGRRLGAFLGTLHALDTAAAGALGVPGDDDPELEAWSAAALEDLHLAVEHGHVELHRATDWKRRLTERPPRGRDAPRLLHGDFAAEHVLVDAHGAPTGVIDWSDACVGDPARDLAGLLHWGGARMLAATLETYGPVSPAVLSRARWFAACRAVADIAFGQTQRRPEYLVAGQRALTGLEEHPSFGD